MKRTDHSLSPDSNRKKNKTAVNITNKNKRSSHIKNIHVITTRYVGQLWKDSQNKQELSTKIPRKYYLVKFDEKNIQVFKTINSSLSLKLHLAVNEDKQDGRKGLLHIFITSGKNGTVVSMMQKTLTPFKNIYTLGRKSNFLIIN